MSEEGRSDERRSDERHADGRHGDIRSRDEQRGETRRRGLRQRCVQRAEHQRSGESRRGTSTTALVVLFALAFVATTFVLRRVLPGGTGLERNEIKLDRFRERADETSVLFFGSSRTHRGFVPSLFDQRMHERGVETHSFNFGVPGALAVDTQHLLARVVELAPPGIDYVFVDPERLSIAVDTRNNLARSVIDWHEPRITALITRYVLNEPLSRAEQLALLDEHWRCCLYNVTNVGRGLRWVDGALGVAPSGEKIAEQLGPLGDGYAPQLTEGEEVGARGGRIGAKLLPKYLEALEHARHEQLSEGPPDPFALELFALISERVEALGAVPVFVIQPALDLQHDLIKAAQRGDVKHLLRFDGPDRYPELYAPENRFNNEHLNDDGARLFTELLAREFAAALERGEFRKP